MGKYRSRSGLNTNWQRSVSGIILANKQTNGEAIPLLYQSCVFHFESLRLARSFLSTVGKVNLMAIRTLRLSHAMQRVSSAPKASKSKSDADAGFTTMCQQIVDTLPNLLELNVRLDPMEHLETLVPTFKDPMVTFTSSFLDELSWLQPLKLLSKLSKLETVVFELRELNDRDLSVYFTFLGYARLVPPSANGTKQVHTVVEYWIAWYRRLHKSLDEAVRRIILNKDNVWQDHLEVLEKYQEWRLDPTRDLM